MQRSKRISISLAAALFAVAGIWGTSSRAADSAAPGGQVVTGAWQHHHVNFSYFGITALYSCDGLESNIRSLLLHLGARKDAKVNARGCPNGPAFRAAMPLSTSISIRSRRTRIRAIPCKPNGCLWS